MGGWREGSVTMTVMAMVAGGMRVKVRLTEGLGEGEGEEVNGDDGVGGSRTKRGKRNCEGEGSPAAGSVRAVRTKSV